MTAKDTKGAKKMGGFSLLFAEKDHAKVREAKMRVLLAPEMSYAVPPCGLSFSKRCPTT